MAGRARPATRRRRYRRALGDPTACDAGRRVGETVTGGVERLATLRPCSTSAGSAPSSTPCRPAWPVAATTTRVARAGPRARRAPRGSWRPSATRCGPRSTTMSKEVGRPAGVTARPTRPRPCRPRAGRSASASACSTSETTRSPRELRDLLLRIPNLPAADAPDGAGEDDNVVVRVVGFDPDAYADAPARAALGDRRRARHPRPRAGGQDLGLDVRDVPRARAPRSRGRSCQLALDRNSRRLRGDPAADARAAPTR